MEVADCMLTFERSARRHTHARFGLVHNRQFLTTLYNL